MKRFNDEKLIYICDRFFLGGPHTLRGFDQRGVGPHSDNQAIGAHVNQFKLLFALFLEPTCLIVS